MKQIEIVVSPEGQCRFETKGFNGSDCQQASRFLEEALGNSTSEQLTPEFHQQQQQTQQAQEGA